MLARAALVAIVLVGGCSLGRGTVPVAAPSEHVGFGTKMLRPQVSARACGTTFGPFDGGGDRDLLARALSELLAVDDEADVLLDLDVQWRGLDLLLVQIGCVRVRGDVARMTSSVRLPMLGGHEHHAH